MVGIHSRAANWHQIPPATFLYTVTFLLLAPAYVQSLQSVADVALQEKRASIRNGMGKAEPTHAVV